MEDNKELARTNMYFELAKEHYAWDRHHDGQRSSICSIVMVFSGILLSIVEISNKSYEDVVIIGAIIFLSGLFGVAFVYKQYERMKFHDAKYQYYRNLAGSNLDIDFSNEEDILAKDHAYKRIRLIHKRFNIHRYWFVLMAMVALIGIYVMWSALKGLW